MKGCIGNSWKVVENIKKEECIRNKWKMIEQTLKTKGCIGKCWKWWEYYGKWSNVLKTVEQWLKHN